MTVEEKIIYAFALVLLGLPAPLLVYAWYRWHTRRKVERSDNVVFALLAIPTMSYILSLLGLAFEDVVGPYYSTRGMVTIYVNLGLMAAITLCAAFTSSSLRRILLLSIGAVVLVWAYLAVVSSAV